jgi:hypothetical protein
MDQMVFGNHRTTDQSSTTSLSEGLAPRKNSHSIGNSSSQYVQESAMETSLFQETFLNTDLNTGHAG